MLTRGMFWKGVRPCLPRIYGSFSRGIPSSTNLSKGIHSKSTSKPTDQVFLYGKSPQAVEQSLQKLNLSPLPVESQSNLQFVDLYLKKLNVMNYKRTTNHLNRFQSQIKKLKVENDVELYRLVVKYLVEEADMEIKRFAQFGADYLMKSRLDFLQTHQDPEIKGQSEDIETFVMDNIISDSNTSNDDCPYLSHLQSLFNILNELRINPEMKWDQYISVDQLVEIFEMSKLIPDPEWSEKGIFLSASILYSTKKIRMDPVNESFYINSLIRFGHNKTGFQLFRSNKDNMKEKWWMEIGLMLSLVNNNLRSFQKLLYEMDETYPNATLSPKILKLAIRKYAKISSNNNIKLNLLLNKFINSIKINGIRKHRDEIPEKMVNFTDEQEANQYLNRIELISYDDIVSVVNSLLFNKRTELIGPFLHRILSLKDVDETFWDILIIKTKLKLLKDFDSIKSLLPRSHDTSPATKKNLNQFEGIFNKITSKYIEENDPVIDLLLFDNINDLVSNYRLPVEIEELLQTIMSPDNAEIEVSKYFDVLLKSFLSVGDLTKAQELLKIMERMRTDPEFALKNNTKYPPIDIEHYTTMVRYYTSKAVISRAPGIWKSTEQIITEITNKVNLFNLPYSSSFITRLIIFYRENKDFNRCFLIINETLSQSKLVKETAATGVDQAKSSNPLLRQKLYFEIWKVYFQFYRIASLELITTGTQKNLKKWTSFYNTFQRASVLKPSVDLVSLFETMVQSDNVLPDETFCKLIISTFMKARNWSSIPAILTYFTQIFNIELDSSFISTILTGVRKEFIAKETQSILKNDHSLSLIEAKIKAKQESKILEENEKILSSSSNEDMINSLLENIFLLLKYSNPFDTQFNEVREVYQKLNLMDNYPESIISSCK